MPSNPRVWIHCMTWTTTNICSNTTINVRMAGKLLGFYAKIVVTCCDTSLGSQHDYCILSHFSMQFHATKCNLLPADTSTNPAAFHSFLPRQSSSRASILLHSFESTISFLMLATGLPLAGPFWVADANLPALGSSPWLTSLELDADATDQT